MLVQEALTNCVRHAQATRAVVRLASQNGGVHVSVTDDGLGFDPARRAFHDRLFGTRVIQA